MSEQWANKHLHGVKLDRLITKLVDHYAWEGLAEIVSINCFKKNPSVKSSVKFLLKTPWALKNVQDLYVALMSGKPVSEVESHLKDQVPVRERDKSAADTVDENDPWAKARKRKISD